jgi:hypothetical protein
MTKIDTCHPRWPDETYPLWNNERNLENRKTMIAFLQGHEYRKTWENNAFEVWEPPTKKLSAR